MNDTELDELLNQWDAPRAPPSLRGRIRRGLQPERRRWFTWLPVGWKGLVAGGLAAGVVCLIVVAEAFPQATGLFWPASPALTQRNGAFSDSIEYGDDGSSRIGASILSYSYHGTEIVVSESYPTNPVQDAVVGFHNGIHLLLLRFVPGLVLPDEARSQAYIASGCVRPGGIVTGHETLLNYPTTRVQYINRDRSRTTLWMAPDLECFPLKIDNENQRSDGTYRLVSERLTRRVMVRH